MFCLLCDSRTSHCPGTVYFSRMNSNIYRLIHIISTCIFMTEKKVFTTSQAKNIGEQLGIKWDKYDIEQFRMGMDVELEHGKVDPHTNVTDNDPLTTGKIALAHLNEFPDYYTRLEKMEEEADQYWAKHAR